MEVVICEYQLKLQEKSYSVILVEIPQDDMDKQEYMKRILAHTQSLEHDDSSYLVWNFNREHFRFKVEEVYYIYSYLRKAEVHTHSGIFRISTTLAREEIKLRKDGFIRVHQGYLVRREAIRCIRTKDLILENNVHIPLGNRYKKNVNRIMEMHRSEKTPVL